MGATVIDDGVVTFRFTCRRCDVAGTQFADIASAHAEGHAHWMGWHGHDGEVLEGDDHAWYWHCHGCMRTVDERPASSEAGAREAGFAHWLEAFHHQGEFGIEQLGTYDPEVYDEEQGVCGYTEDHSGSD
jgi:hypothetical protein